MSNIGEKRKRNIDNDSDLQNTSPVKKKSIEGLRDEVVVEDEIVGDCIMVEGVEDDTVKTGHTKTEIRQDVVEDIFTVQDGEIIIVEDEEMGDDIDKTVHTMTEIRKMIQEIQNYHSDFDIDDDLLLNLTEVMRNDFRDEIRNLLDDTSKIQNAFDFIETYNDFKYQMNLMESNDKVDKFKDENLCVLEKKIEKLRSYILNLEAFPLTVYFFGVPGTGKSSLINSILEMELLPQGDLKHRDNGGYTRAPTEILLSTETRSYAVEGFYFEDEEQQYSLHEFQHFSEVHNHLQEVYSNQSKPLLKIKILIGSPLNIQFFKSFPNCKLVDGPGYPEPIEVKYRSDQKMKEAIREYGLNNSIDILVNTSTAVNPTKEDLENLFDLNLVSFLQQTCYGTSILFNMTYPGNDTLTYSPKKKFEFLKSAIEDVLRLNSDDETTKYRDKFYNPTVAFIKHWEKNLYYHVNRDNKTGANKKLEIILLKKLLEKIVYKTYACARYASVFCWQIHSKYKTKNYKGYKKEVEFILKSFKQYRSEYDKKKTEIHTFVDELENDFISKASRNECTSYISSLKNEVFSDVVYCLKTDKSILKELLDELLIICKKQIRKKINQKTITKNGKPKTEMDELAESLIKLLDEWFKQYKIRFEEALGKRLDHFQKMRKSLKPGKLRDIKSVLNESYFPDPLLKMLVSFDPFECWNGEHKDVLNLSEFKKKFDDFCNSKLADDIDNAGKQFKEISPYREETRFKLPTSGGNSLKDMVKKTESAKWMNKNYKYLIAEDQEFKIPKEESKLTLQYREIEIIRQVPDHLNYHIIMEREPSVTLYSTNHEDLIETYKKTYKYTDELPPIFMPSVNRYDDAWEPNLHLEDLMSYEGKVRIFLGIEQDDLQFYLDKYDKEVYKNYLELIILENACSVGWNRTVFHLFAEYYSMLRFFTIDDDIKSYFLFSEIHQKYKKCKIQEVLHHMNNILSFEINQKHISFRFSSRIDDIREAFYMEAYPKKLTETKFFETMQNFIGLKFHRPDQISNDDLLKLYQHLRQYQKEEDCFHDFMDTLMDIFEHDAIAQIALYRITNRKRNYQVNVRKQKPETHVYTIHRYQVILNNLSAIHGIHPLTDSRFFERKMSRTEAQPIRSSVQEKIEKVKSKMSKSSIKEIGQIRFTDPEALQLHLGGYRFEDELYNNILLLFGKIGFLAISARFEVSSKLKSVCNGESKIKVDSEQDRSIEDESKEDD